MNGSEAESPQIAEQGGSHNETAEQPALGLVRSDQIFLMSVGTLGLLILCYQFWQLTPNGKETIEIRHLQPAEYLFQIEINSATWVEWMQLDGIGEMTARKIVDDIKNQGPFRSINDVQRVKGIGQKTLDKIRPHLICSDCE